MVKLPTLAAVGERMKKARQDLGMTQGAVAEESGISINTIHRIEGGENTSLLSILLLLEVYELPLLYLEEEM